VVVEVVAAAGGGVSTAMSTHITWPKSQISCSGNVKAMTLNAEKYGEKPFRTY